MVDSMVVMCYSFASGVARYGSNHEIFMLKLKLKRFWSSKQIKHWNESIRWHMIGIRWISDKQHHSNMRLTDKLICAPFSSVNKQKYTSAFVLLTFRFNAFWSVHKMTPQCHQQGKNTEHILLKWKRPKVSQKHIANSEVKCRAKHMVHSFFSHLNSNEEKMRWKKLLLMPSLATKFAHCWP